jgi:hypothetical protein
VACIHYPNYIYQSIIIQTINNTNTLHVQRTKKQSLIISKQKMKKQRGVTISTPKEPLIQDKSKGVPLQTKNPIKGFKSHLKPLYIKSVLLTQNQHSI